MDENTWQINWAFCYGSATENKPWNKGQCSLCIYKEATKWMIIQKVKKKRFSHKIRPGTSENFLPHQIWVLSGELRPVESEWAQFQFGDFVFLSHKQKILLSWLAHVIFSNATTSRPIDNFFYFRRDMTRNSLDDGLLFGLKLCLAPHVSFSCI